MLFVNSVHSPEWRACVIPQVLFVLPATPELHGYPLRCRERKRGKERETKRKCMCVASRSLAPVLYKAMKSDGEKEEDGRQSDGREVKKGRTSEHRQCSVSAQLRGSHSVSQTGDASHLEDFAAASTHPQRAPGTVPVLVLIVSVADCAFDWCMLVSRRHEALV